MTNPSFDMDVKFKDGTIAQQNYAFSDEKDKIVIGGFKIEKDDSNKWSLNFSLDDDNLKEVSKAIARPHEIHMETRQVKIPLNKVVIAENGNIEFELESTTDRATGKTRKFTITPNSVKTSSTEIAVTPAGKVMDVTLPKNFPELFLGNESTSSISSTLPAEFFNSIISNKEFFSDIKVQEIKNSINTKSINLLKVGDNVYTQVNSKMMKTESVFHIHQSEDNERIGFVFKKGAEKIARTLDNVDKYDQSLAMLFMGISPTDWFDKSKHFYDDTTLATQKLTAKEFETTPKSRAKNLTSDGIEPELEPDPTSMSPDSTPDSTQEMNVVANEPDETSEQDNNPTPPSPTEEETDTSDSDSEQSPENEQPDAAPKQPDAAPDTEAKQAKPEAESTPEQKSEPNKPKSSDKKESKNEKYQFSTAPLFYGLGILLLVLSIITGMVGLLAFGTLLIATPKLTEGIVNDARKSKSVEKSSSNSKEKLKTKELTKAKIKQKYHNLKRAFSSMKKCEKDFEMNDDWNKATEKLFNQKTKKLTKEATQAIKQFDIRQIKKDKINKHAEKISETEEYLKTLKTKINSRKSSFDDETKQELLEQIEHTQTYVDEAQKLNDNIQNKYNVMRSVKTQSAFNVIIPKKLSAGLDMMGINPLELCEGDTSFAEDKNKIELINNSIKSNYDKYVDDISQYLSEDGMLDNQIKQIHSILDKHGASEKKIDYSLNSVL